MKNDARAFLADILSTRPLRGRVLFWFLTAVSGVGRRMIDLQIRAGGSGDNGRGLRLAMSGLALELGNRRQGAAGPGMGPLRAGHAFFCHRVPSNQVRLPAMARISAWEAACRAWSMICRRVSSDNPAKWSMACLFSARAITNPVGRSLTFITSQIACHQKDGLSAAKFSRSGELSGSPRPTPDPPAPAGRPAPAAGAAAPDTPPAAPVSRR